MRSFWTSRQPSARSFRAATVLSAICFVGFATLRCANDEGAGPGFQSGGSIGSSSGESDLVIGSGSGGNGATSLPLDPLCGKGECIPDNNALCGLGGAGGESSAGGAAGGVSYQPGDLAVQVPSCQVGPEMGCVGTNCPILRECRTGGAGQSGDPCISQTDCSPSLACVGDGSTGFCRPYCCAGSEASCDDRTYCDERTLVDSPSTYVPVCLPVDDCSLLEPYPCTGEDCACKAGQACIVVRQDGSTACTAPGNLRAGNPCSGLKTAECDYGFVCSPSAGCMKLCTLAEGDADCPDGGTCLGRQSVLGEGLGVCVGTETDTTGL